VHTAPTSSGKILRLNCTSREVELVQAYFPPDDLLAKSQGSTQILSDGHALVNWGSEGAVTEFRADGTPIYHAYMDSGVLGVGVENYRAFKYSWTGTPNEEPAVVALYDHEGTRVYVSWNGDTETRRWRFYEVEWRGKYPISSGEDEDVGAKRLLGEVERTSFETTFSFGRKVRAVIAEAVDKGGKALRSSAAVLSEPEVSLPSKETVPKLGLGGNAGLNEQPSDL
jgi:hypothetical protein